MQCYLQSFYGLRPAKHKFHSLSLWSGWVIYHWPLSRFAPRSYNFPAAMSRPIDVFMFPQRHGSYLFKSFFKSNNFLEFN